MDVCFTNYPAGSGAGSARILAPSDFGILGLALLTTRIARIFTETGFDEALVQRQGDIKPYLNAAWTVHVFRGLILFGLMFVGAPYFVQLLNNPNDPLDLTTTTSALRVISFFVLLIILRNVWALIWGKLAGEFILFVLSYIMHPFRPRFRFDGTRVRELWAYGKWGLGMAVIGFLITEGDDFLVLKILGPTMMGLYLMAHKIGWLPITEISVVISHVTFPAYAKVQNDISRLREAYLKVLQFTAFLSFPLAVMLIVLGEDFTLLFMKAKWGDMVPALQLLATMAIFNSLATCAVPLFRAVGRPKIVTGLMFGKLLFLAVLIYPLIKRWGITGAGVAVLFSTLLNQPFVYYMVVKILGCRYRDILRELLTPAAGILVMTASITGLKYIWGMEIGVGVFFLCAGSGMIGYIIAVFWLDRIIGSSMKEMIHEQLRIFLPKK